MREIVLDTETTGLDPLMGHRLVEIGCVELVNHLPTGRHWHTFINPQRDMPHEAYEVHGLSEDFLSDKPLFEAICDERSEEHTSELQSLIRISYAVFRLKKN